MKPSVSTILQHRVRIPSTNSLIVGILNFICYWIVKRAKIKKKSLVLGHIKKQSSEIYHLKGITTK